MSFILYYPQKSGATTTVTLPNPERDNILSSKKGQAKGRTRGGQRRVYDKGTDQSFAQYSFPVLTDSEKTALQGFFDSQADGMAEEFQYDDHLGVTRTAVFDQDSLEWTNIGELTPPSADPLWSLSIRLEIVE